MSRYELGVVAAALAVVALALALDQGDGGHGGERRGDVAAPARSLTQKDVARIARRVERLRGLRFERPVKPLFVGRARAGRLGRALGSRKERRGVLVTAEELKLLGVLAPSDDLARILSAVEKEQVLGFYEPRSKRLVVVKELNGGAQSSALQEITLAHELTHALEDQRFGFPDPVGFSDDRATAVIATLEGTATALETEYADRYVGLGKLLGASLTALSGTATKLPPYVERSLLFPYEKGALFVEAFKARGNWRAINRVLRLRLPRTTEQILHPDKYAQGELGARIADSRLGRTLGRGWRLLDAATFGEFDVDAIVRQLAKDGAVAVDAAAGWNGGRLELFRRGPLLDQACRPPCVARDLALLELAWDTDRDGAEAASALRKAYEHGLETKRLASGRGLHLWSSRGGAIGLAAGEARTTLVFAPSASLAARVLHHVAG